MKKINGVNTPEAGELPPKPDRGAKDVRRALDRFLDKRSGLTPEERRKRDKAAFNSGRWAT